MENSTKNRIACALAAVAAAVHQKNTTELTTSVLCHAAASSSGSSEHKACGTYKRGGALPPPQESVWGRLERNSKLGSMEFFMFLGLSRSAFDDLVDLCTPAINENPMNRDYGTPDVKQLRRRLYGPRGIMAMTLKSLTSAAEAKDIYVQFGATAMVYRNAIELGMVAIVANMGHPKLRVFWDRSEEALERMSRKTAAFLDIPGVIGMVDGRKMTTLYPSGWLEQNRDYNGWTKEVNRNVVLLWSPDGLIIDAAVNCPGNFHDSKSTLWTGMYDHIAALPDGFIVVCDSAFVCTGKMKGKLVKLRDDKNGFAFTGFDESLTHLRQASEWGNGVLVNAFRRLRRPLPAENVRRAHILWSCILMHNYRTNTCDRNQIATYFNNIFNDNNLEYVLIHLTYIFRFKFTNSNTLNHFHFAPS